MPMATTLSPMLAMPPPANAAPSTRVFRIWTPMMPSRNARPPSCARFRRVPRMQVPLMLYKLEALSRSIRPGTKLAAIIDVPRHGQQIGALIYEMGRALTQGNTSSSRRRRILQAWEAAQLGASLACYSRATTSKLMISMAICAAQWDLRSTPGFTPSVNWLRAWAFSRRSRASFSPISGQVPRDRRFSLPRCGT